MSYSIAYVGPTLSGRSTSMAHLLRSTEPDLNAILIQPGTEHAFVWEGLEFSAWLCSVRSHYAFEDVNDGGVPAAVRDELDRLAHADGVIFVLDSQHARLEANRYELRKLRRDLETRGVEWDSLPLVFQANKRDLANPLSMDQLVLELGIAGRPIVGSVATEGRGVEAAFDALVDEIRRV